MTGADRAPQPPHCEPAQVGCAADSCKPEGEKSSPHSRGVWDTTDLDLTQEMEPGYTFNKMF